MIRRLLRWLWHGKGGTYAPPFICTFCTRGHCVHDKRTGACITVGCQCLEDR